EEGGGPSHKIYLRAIDGSPATLIGEGDGQALSPDGRWALSREVAARGALVLLPTGVGSPKKLQPDGLTGRLTGCFFPDGKRLAVEESFPNQPSKTYVVPVDGSRPVPLGPPGLHLPEFGHAVSPDGRLVALIDAEGKAVLVTADGGGAPQPVPGLEPG